MSLLAELLEFPVPVLETMASEAASLGFKMNNGRRQKNQALGHRANVPSSITVQSQEVAVVD